MCIVLFTWKSGESVIPASADLAVEATPNTLVCAFVLSKLNYCNYIESGCRFYIHGRLQRVQNSEVKLVNFKA